MKKIIAFSFVLSTILFPSILSAQGGSYIIHGQIGHLSAPAKAYLIYDEADSEKSDSVTLRDGTFIFKGAIENPVVAHLFVSTGGKGLSSIEGLSQNFLYLEAGKIEVRSPDSLQKAQITGGPLNLDNERLKLLQLPYRKQLRAVDKAYNDAPEEKKQSQAFNTDYDQRREAIIQQFKIVDREFIAAHPNSLLSLYLVKILGDPVPDAAVVEPLFNSLSPAIRQGKMGLAYAAEITRLKRFALGHVAPDFTQADTSGKAVSLHDFRGKYVLVDFWASWCVPCRAENPNVVKAFDLYKGKGFTIISVSLDIGDGKKNWMDAIHADNLHWTNLSDLKGWKNEVAQLYMVRSVPQNFLVSPDGKIVAKNLAGEELNNKLKELLDK